MKKAQASVRAFHKALEHPINGKPTRLDSKEGALRIGLIKEQAQELVRSIQGHDLVNMAKGMADLIYVVLGTAVTYGIDLPPVFEEVHRSNMTKVGGEKRGQVLKPEGYEPPDIKGIIEKQRIGGKPSGGAATTKPETGAGDTPPSTDGD